MVDNMSNVRRGPRTFWASPGPEYNYNVQRAQHRSDYKSVAHPLPPPKVSFYHYVKTIRPLSYKTYVFLSNRIIEKNGGKSPLTYRQVPNIFTST